MNTKAEPLVSVIVPIYNTQEFLPRCLDSILNQSYINMEIILVNDGSTDDSLTICERYAANDDRIRIISQVNQGALVARKKGVKACRGEYIMFVDSDDWIEPELLKAMVRAMQESECPLICTNVYMDYEDGTSREYRNAMPTGVYYTDSIAKDIFYYKNMDCYGILPYNVAKLYAADIVKDVIDNADDDIRYGEDRAVLFSIVYKNIKICFTDDIYYHYCIRDDSASQSENPNYFVLLAAFYKCVKKIFDAHREREYLLRQLGRYLLQEAHHAINNRLGLATADKPIYKEPGKPYILDFSVFLPQKKKIILYGAGNVGSDYQKQLSDCANIELCGWVDKDYEKYQDKGFRVQPVDYIKELEYDYILVAVRKQKIFKEIEQGLEDMGILKTAIIWGRPYGAPYEEG